jgi:serine/threonine protein kinase
MAAFGQPVEEFGTTAEEFIDNHINKNSEIVKIADNDEQMDLIWEEDLKYLNFGGFGTVKVNKVSGDYVVKQIDIGRQIERKGHMYAINNIRNEVLIYHYIAKKCMNVCDFIGCYYHTIEKQLYVKSKYCGRDSHSILYDPYVNPDIKREIFGKIINNLKCLHDNGVVYRDLKPENITISNDNKVTFIDFGLSYFCEDAGVSNVLKRNQNRDIIGTKLYGDPTRPINNDNDLKKTDTYSLGVIFAIMFSKEEYLEFLFNSNVNGTPFMYRVGTMPEETKTEFWREFNKNVKKILGDEINDTHFFGGFDVRLTSKGLQYAFKRTQLFDYQREIKDNVTRAPTRSNDDKSFCTSRKSIVNKIKTSHKQQTRHMQSASLEGGNNKTKRHRKTRGRKNYRRK